MKLFLDTHMLGKKQTGNERYWKNLVLALGKIIEPKSIYLYCNLPKEKLPKEFHLFNIYTPKYTNGFYRIFFGFNDAIKKIKPDLIHVQNFTPFKKTVPIVNTIHDVCFKTYPQVFNLKSKSAFSLFFSHSLKLSDVIICPSFFVKKMLIRYYPFVNEEKVKVIYEAADPVFKYIENKKKVKKFLKEKINIDGDFFLVVGEIQPRKRPFEIIEIFKEINKKHPNINLVFAGPNRLNIKPQKNIKILEYISDEELNYLYNGALALVYFSLCEGFGLPLVEAMKTKTPIIASKIEVFEEITQNSALLVKNKKELFLALKKVIENKKFCQNLSLKASYQSQKFSWKKAGKEVKKIYQETIFNF